jgi:hypothetical protein
VKTVRIVVGYCHVLATCIKQLTSSVAGTCQCTHTHTHTHTLPSAASAAVAGEAAAGAGLVLRARSGKVVASGGTPDEEIGRCESGQVRAISENSFPWKFSIAEVPRELPCPNVHVYWSKLVWQREGFG